MPVCTKKGIRIIEHMLGVNRIIEEVEAAELGRRPSFVVQCVAEYVAQRMAFDGFPERQALREDGRLDPFRPMPSCACRKPEV